MYYNIIYYTPIFFGFQVYLKTLWSFKEDIMQQKYTITIADVQMNVISDESPEAVEALVGLVDRKMREITGGSHFPKSEAALLCALDYCSERIKSQRKVKALETKLAYTETALEELELENEQLRKEIETLKMMIAQ